MAVPAHDERDFAFARAYGLMVRPVIQPPDAEPLDGATMQEAVIAKGSMIDSGPLTGTPTEQAIPRTIRWLVEQNLGHADVNYRLRDWLISRQRYWGCPIPVVHCPTCGAVPVPEEELPIELPEDVEWRPTGESPLKFHPTWRHTACPSCGAAAERETDTMDTFMCSSWYHLRYLSPDCDAGPFDAEEYRYWMPVDTYTGGVEHATMHLIYTRFFHKACRDLGIGSGDEPMTLLYNQGQILGSDGQRMSKSRGNVVDPDQQVARYGADAVRAFLMFGYRWSEGGPWTDNNIHGVVRWLNRVWDLTYRLHARGGADGAADQSSAGGERALLRATHQTIQSVSHDLDGFEFNTVVSGLMQLANALLAAEEECGGTAAYRESVLTLLTLMAPVTPHVAEELWELLGRPYSIHQQPWPEADAALAAAETVTLVVQVNGKVRGRVEVPAGIDRDEAQRLAQDEENVARTLAGREPRRVIHVAGKLINFVV
jgi:leucyl-tRNA synthetase